MNGLESMAHWEMTAPGASLPVTAGSKGASSVYRIWLSEAQLGARNGWLLCYRSIRRRMQSRAGIKRGSRVGVHAHLMTAGYWLACGEAGAWPARKCAAALISSADSVLAMAFMAWVGSWRWPCLKALSWSSR